VLFRSSTERLQKLVSDLLDVTRLQNLRLKLERDILDLRGVMEQAVENLAPLMAQKGQELKLSIPNGSLLVLGDHRRIEQVLGNLLVNAHQYTPEGGRVTLSALERGDKIVISVADTGPGIPPAERDQLFERFYRGPSGQRPSGLGLGLAIAKGIVELHGGKIWVESEPGEGSVFSFSLPRAHSDEDPHH
jgi:signal transduction histidine kinase